MTDEYFVYIDKLQHQEEDARRQKEQVYIQMRTAYENLKRDNIQQLSNYTKNPLLVRMFHELNWADISDS